MRNRLFLCLLTVCTTAAWGQSGTDMRAWLADVPDSVMVARLLIPGAHDAGTGDGFPDNRALAYAVTQDIGIWMQFESGIRAFDLRPVMHGDTMQIAHALFDTKISFGQALDIILSELDAHPTEFAIILMRNECDTQRGSGSWSALMERELARVGNRLAMFSDSLRVGQLRGQILILSRDNYNGTLYGATIPNWPDMPTLTETELQGNFGQTTLLVQDYYETVGARQQVKNAALEALLDLSAEHHDHDGVAWILNYASGYAATTDEGYSLSTGYRLNASATSAAIRSHLAAWHGKTKPSGIVFMDFAGVDWSEGYNVGGLALTRMLVETCLR